MRTGPAFKSRLHRAHHDERGQMAFLLVFILIGFFMLMGLALDAGLWYFDHRRAQNEVDAAALAAVLPPALPSATTDAALAVAIDYLKRNSVPDAIADNMLVVTGQPDCGTMAVNTAKLVLTDAVLADGSPGSDGKYDTARVCLRRESAVIFGRLVGLNQAVVSAGSAARVKTQPPEGTWAIFANCDPQYEDDGGLPLEFNGQHGEIIGRVHSNCNLKMSGQDITFQDLVTCQTISDPGKADFEDGLICPDPEIRRPLPIPHPDTWNEICLVTAANGTDCATWNPICQTISSTVDNVNSLAPGVYCRNGQLELKGSNQTANGVTFVASGIIKVPDNNIAFNPTVDPAWENILMFSHATGKAVEMGGQATNWTGIVYAPRGQVIFNGSGSSGNPADRLFVSIIADRVQMPGSEYVLNGIEVGPTGSGSYEIALIE